MIQIRDATVADVDALAALVAELGFPTSASDLAHRLDALIAAGEVVLVAEREGSVAGLATVHITPVLHRPTCVGRLTALVVSERLRGQGIGRALVEAAERVVADRGCALIEVTSNRRLADAHAFYERLGYEVTSLRFKKILKPAAH
ncbi:MAG TPA: GNAT family N-acetyltransferase [Vicinamibacterales bacterium]|nr:GNAT family N-acetyltransferase [Vicinamibacterales bacterium]